MQIYASFFYHELYIYIFTGHAIEAGWFLLKHAVKTNDERLKTTAINKFIVNPFLRGWDEKHGGLFCFVDVDGWSPTQLEWDMKLWWPHNEALIAFLMAYTATGEVQLLETFAKVFDWSYSHVRLNHLRQPTSSSSSSSSSAFPKPCSDVQSCSHQEICCPSKGRRRSPKFLV